MVTETLKYEVAVLDLVYWDSYCVLGHGPTLICENPPSYLGHRSSDASANSDYQRETLEDSGELEIASENQYEVFRNETEKQITKDEDENEALSVSEELKKDDQYEKCEKEGTYSNKLDSRLKTEFEQTAESEKQYDSLRSKRKVFIEITVKHYSIEGDQLVECVPQNRLSRTQSLDTNRSTWNLHSFRENFGKLAVNQRYMDPRPEIASVAPVEESQMNSENGQDGSDLTSYYSNERLSTTFDSLSDDVFETESQTEARRELMGFVLHRTKKKSNLLEDISPEKVSYDLPESPENTDIPEETRSDEDDADNVRDVSDDDSESIDAYKVIDEAFADILSFDSFSTQFTESSDNMSLWSLTEYDNQVDRVERFVCISDRECFDYSGIKKDDTLVEDLNSTDTVKSDIVELDYNEDEIDTFAETDLSDYRKEETVEIDENTDSTITGKVVNGLKYIGNNVTKDKGDIGKDMFENNSSDHDDALDHMVDVTHERNFDIKNENILKVKYEMKTNLDENENKQIISKSPQKIPKLEINNSSFKDESESDEYEGEELQVSVDFEIHVRVDLGSSRCSSPVSSRFGSAENLQAIDNSHLMVNAVDIGDALDFEAVTGDKDNRVNLRLQQEAAERIAKDIADRVLRESKSLVAQSAEKAISNRRRGSSQYEDRGLEDIIEENMLCISDRNESVEGQFNRKEGENLHCDKVTDVREDLVSDHFADIVSENESNAKCHYDLAVVGEVVTFVARERYATDIANPVSDVDKKVEQLEWNQNDEQIDTDTVKGNTMTNIHDKKLSVDASYKGAIIETPTETQAGIPGISVHTETNIAEYRPYNIVKESLEFPIDKSVQTENQTLNIQCDLMEPMNQNHRETVSETIVEEPSVTEFPSTAEITYNIPETLIGGHEVCRDRRADIYSVLQDDKYTCEQISELHDDGAVFNDNDGQKINLSETYVSEKVSSDKPVINIEFEPQVEYVASGILDRNQPFTEIEESSTSACLNNTIEKSKTTNEIVVDEARVSLDQSGEMAGDMIESSDAVKQSDYTTSENTYEIIEQKTESSDKNINIRDKGDNIIDYLNDFRVVTVEQETKFSVHVTGNANKIEAVSVISHEESNFIVEAQEETFDLNVVNLDKKDVLSESHIVSKDIQRELSEGYTSSLDKMEKFSINVGDECAVPDNIKAESLDSQVETEIEKIETIFGGSAHNVDMDTKQQMTVEAHTVTDEEEGLFTEFISKDMDTTEYNGDYLDKLNIVLESSIGEHNISAELEEENIVMQESENFAVGCVDNRLIVHENVLEGFISSVSEKMIMNVATDKIETNSDIITEEKLETETADVLMKESDKIVAQDNTVFDELTSYAKQEETVDVALGETDKTLAKNAINEQILYGSKAKNADVVYGGSYNQEFMPESSVDNEPGALNVSIELDDMDTNGNALETAVDESLTVENQDRNVTVHGVGSEDFVYCKSVNESETETLNVAERDSDRSKPASVNILDERYVASGQEELIVNNTVGNSDIIETVNEASDVRFGFCKSDSEAQRAMPVSANIVKTETMSDHDTHLETVDEGSFVDKRTSLEDMAFKTELQVETGNRDVDQEVGSTVHVILDMNSAERLQIMHTLYIWTKKQDARNHSGNMETSGDLNLIPSDQDEGTSVDFINIADIRETVSETDDANLNANEVTEFKTAVNESNVAVGEEAGTSVDIRSIKDDGDTQFVTAVDTQFAYQDNEEGTSVDVTSILGENEYDLDTSVDGFCVTLDQESSLSVDDLSIIDSTENDFETAVGELDYTADQSIKEQENVFAHLNQNVNMAITSEDESVVYVENATALSVEVMGDFENIDTLEDEHGCTVKQEVEYTNVVIAYFEKTKFSVQPLSPENGSDNEGYEAEAGHGPQSAVNTLSDELFVETSDAVYNENLVETTSEASVYELPVQKETLSAEVTGDMNQIEILPNGDSILVDIKELATVSQLDQYIKGDQDTDLKSLNTDTIENPYGGDRDKEIIDKEMFFRHQDNHSLETIPETEEKFIEESEIESFVTASQCSEISRNVHDYGEKEADLSDVESDNFADSSNNISNNETACLQNHVNDETEVASDKWKHLEGHLSEISSDVISRDSKETAHVNVSTQHGRQETEIRDIASVIIETSEYGAEEDVITDEADDKSVISQHSEETTPINEPSLPERQETKVVASKSGHIETTQMIEVEPSLPEQREKEVQGTGNNMLSPPERKESELLKSASREFELKESGVEEAVVIKTSVDISTISTYPEETKELSQVENQISEERDSASGQFETAESGTQETVITTDAEFTYNQDSDKISQIYELFLEELPETEIHEIEEDGVIALVNNGSVISQDLEKMNDSSLQDQQEIQELDSASCCIGIVESEDERASVNFTEHDISFIRQDSKVVYQIHELSLPEREETEKLEIGSGCIETAASRDAVVIDTEDAESYTSQESDMKARDSASDKVEIANYGDEEGIINNTADAEFTIIQDSEETFSSLPENLQKEVRESVNEQAVVADTADVAEISVSHDSDGTSKLNELSRPEHQETEERDSELDIEDAVLTDAADEKFVNNQYTEESTRMHESCRTEQQEMEELGRTSSQVETLESEHVNTVVTDRADADSIINQDSKGTLQTDVHFSLELQETEVEESASGQIEITELGIEEAIVTDAADDKSIICQDLEKTCRLHKSSFPEQQIMEEQESSSCKIEKAVSVDPLVAHTADAEVFIIGIFQINKHSLPEPQETVETVESGVEEAVVTDPGERKPVNSQDSEGTSKMDEPSLPDGDETSKLNEPSLPEQEEIKVQDSATGHIEIAESRVDEATDINAVNDKYVMSRDSEEICQMNEPSLPKREEFEDLDITSGHLEKEDARIEEATNVTNEMNEPSQQEHVEFEEQDSASGKVETAESKIEGVAVTVFSQDSEETTKMNESSVLIWEEIEELDSACGHVETAESRIEEVTVTCTEDDKSINSHDLVEIPQMNEPSLPEREEFEELDIAFGQRETSESRIEEAVIDAADDEFVIGQDSEKNPKRNESSLPEQEEIELDSASGQIETAEFIVEEATVIDAADDKSVVSRDSEKTSKMNKPFLQDRGEFEDRDITSGHLETAQSRIEEATVTNADDNNSVIGQDSEETSEMNKQALPKHEEFEELDIASGQVETAESRIEGVAVTDAAYDKSVISQDSEENSKMNESYLPEEIELDSASGQVKTAESGIEEATVTDAADVKYVNSQDSEETCQMNEPSLPEREGIERDSASCQIETAESNVDEVTVTDAADDKSVKSQDSKETSKMNESSVLIWEEIEELDSACGHVETAESRIEEVTVTCTEDDKSINSHDLVEIPQTNEPSLPEREEFEELDIAFFLRETSKSRIKEAVIDAADDEFVIGQDSEEENSKRNEPSLPEQEDIDLDSASSQIGTAESRVEEAIATDASGDRSGISQDSEETSKMNEPFLPDRGEFEDRDITSGHLETAQSRIEEATVTNADDNNSVIGQDSEETSEMNKQSLPEHEEFEELDIASGQVETAESRIEGVAVTDAAYDKSVISQDLEETSKMNESYLPEQEEIELDSASGQVETAESRIEEATVTDAADVKYVNSQDSEETCQMNEPSLPEREGIELDSASCQIETAESNVDEVTVTDAADDKSDNSQDSEETSKMNESTVLIWDEIEERDSACGHVETAESRIEEATVTNADDNNSVIGHDSEETNEMNKPSVLKREEIEELDSACGQVETAESRIEKVTVTSTDDVNSHDSVESPLMNEPSLPKREEFGELNIVFEERETSESRIEEAVTDAAVDKSVNGQDSEENTQRNEPSLPEQEETELERASCQVEIAKSRIEEATVTDAAGNRSGISQDLEESSQMNEPSLPEQEEIEVESASGQVEMSESGIEEATVTDAADVKYVNSQDSEETCQMNEPSLPEQEEIKQDSAPGQVETAESRVDEVTVIESADDMSVNSQASEETSKMNKPFVLKWEEIEELDGACGHVETAESRIKEDTVTSTDADMSINSHDSEEIIQMNEPSQPEGEEFEELNIAFGQRETSEFRIEAAVTDAADYKSVFGQDSEENSKRNEPSLREQEEIELDSASGHIETAESIVEEAAVINAADDKSVKSPDSVEISEMNEPYLLEPEENEPCRQIEIAETRVEEAIVTDAYDNNTVISQDSEETSKMNEPSLPEQEEIKQVSASGQIETAESRIKEAIATEAADDKSIISHDSEETSQGNEPSLSERNEIEEQDRASGRFETAESRIEEAVTYAANEKCFIGQDSEETSRINEPSLQERKEIEELVSSSSQIETTESRIEEAIVTDAADESVDAAYTANDNFIASQDSKETTKMNEPTKPEKQEMDIVESASSTFETVESEADVSNSADYKSLICQDFDETTPNEPSKQNLHETEIQESAYSHIDREELKVKEAFVYDVEENKHILSNDSEVDAEINEQILPVRQETQVEDSESGQIETAEFEDKRIDVTYTDDDSQDPEIITQMNVPSLIESQEMEELESASGHIETSESGFEESVVTDVSERNHIINKSLEEKTQTSEPSQTEQPNTEVLNSPIEIAEVSANKDVADGEHQIELSDRNDTTSDVCETIKDNDEVTGADSVSTLVDRQEQLPELVFDTGAQQDIEEIDIEKNEIHKTTNVEQSHECEEIEHDILPQDIQLNSFKKDRMLGKKSSSFDIVETEIYSRNQMEEEERLDWRRNRAKSLGHIFKSKLQEELSKQQAYNSLNRKSSFLLSENPVEDRNSKRVTTKTKSTELNEEADGFSNVKGQQRRRSVDLSHYGAISGLSAVEIDFEEYGVEEDERIDSPVDPNIVKQKLEELLKSERRNSLQKETERFNRGAIVDKSFDNEKNESPKFKKHRRERYKDNDKTAVDDLWLRVGGSREDFHSAQYKNYRSFEGDDGPSGRHNRNSSDGQIHVQKSRSRKNSDGQINVQKTRSRHSSQEEVDSVGSPRGQKADYIEIKKFIKEKDKRARKANFLTSAQLRKFSEPKPSVNLNFGPVEMVSLNIDRQVVKDSTSDSQYTRKKDNPLTSDLQKKLERDIEVFEGDSLHMRQNINLQDEEGNTFDVYRYEKHKRKGKRSDHNSEIERKKQDQSYYDNNSVKKTEIRGKKHVHSELNSRHVNWQNIGVLESQSSVSHGHDQYAQNRCLEKHDPSLSCKVVTSHFNQGNGEAFYQRQSDPNYVHGQGKYQQELNVRKKNPKNGNCEKDYYRHRMKIPVSSRETSVDGPLSLTDTFAPMDRGHSTENQNSSNHNLSQSTGKLTDSTTSLNNRQAPAKSPSRQNTLAKQSSIQSSTSELNGEGREEIHGIKFERLKNLEEDELMVKVKEIIGHLDKLEDYHRGDGMRIQKMLGDMYWDYTHLREMIADCMAENGYAVVSMKMLKNLNSIGIFKNDDVWFPTYYTYNTMWNFSDASPNLAKALSENDAVRLLTLNCGHKPYINALHSKNVFYVIKASLSILHNIARNSGMKHLFDENKTSETIMPFLQTEDEMLKILATLTIANIVDEEENKTVIAESGTIHSIVSWIEKAISLPRRRFKGFTPQELTEGLNKLAVNDSNKMRIVEEGGIPLFLLMLQHEDVREQSSAARIIWTLSFDKEVRQNLLESNDLISTLEKLTGSTNKSVQQNANGSLWIIKGENDISRETKPKGKPTNTHVFLSYSWSDKDTVLQIRDRLRAEGYAIWIDIEKGSAATLESMAHAVENAAVVLICMSEKYKQNPNCRTESEYTFQLKKDYIPLMLQKKYRPDGWLGTILGAKLYFDFSGKYPFDKSFTGLLKELRGRGQVTPNTTPGGSSDTTEGALVTSQSLKSLTSPGTPVPSNSVLMHMGQEELVKWLRNVKLTECIPAFLEFDGRLLLQLKQMRVEAPEFFYQCLEKRLNMSLIEILKFTRALEELH